MSEVSLFIDDRQVSIAQGTTILEAAKRAGVHIPTLCDYKSLTPASACRVCLVEVEGAKALVASCSYPVSAGMKVKTDTARVRAARRLVVDLLLSDHPLDCMTCDKSGECELQELAYKLGIKSSRFEGEQHHYPVDLSNPFITRDYKKCVLCGRCVRACEEIQGVGAVDFIDRGFRAKVAVPFDRGLKESDCVFCGQCVQSCPAGALTEKKAKGLARTWETTKRSAPPAPIAGLAARCGCMSKDGRIVKGDRRGGRLAQPGPPLRQGALRLRLHLLRGAAHDARSSEGRRRVPGGFLGRGAGPGRIEVQGDQSPNTGRTPCGGVSCARSINEDSYQMQKLFSAVIGTNNIDHCART